MNVMNCQKLHIQNHEMHVWYSQMHVQIKYFLAHLQDLIPTLAGIKYICNRVQMNIQIFGLIFVLPLCRY